MKTSAYSLLGASLLSLFTAASLFATDTVTNPERKPTSSGWVSAPDASFSVLTYQDTKGHLIVRVNNASLRGLTLQVQTLQGEEVAFVPVHKRQTQFGVRLNVADLTDGDYRLIVATDNERIVKIISLTTPASTPRQAAVAVVTQASEH